MYNLTGILFFLIYLFLLKDNCFTEFCCFSVKPQHESAIGVHISPPFWTSLPSPSPSHSSRLIQSPAWVSWATQQIPVDYLFYIWWCKFPCYSFHTSHPLLPSPHIHKSTLYVCFSIVSLSINSSVPFF